MIIDSLIKEAIDNHVVDSTKLIGCSKREIQLLEEKYKINLPQYYREFLVKMGKNAGGLLDPNEYDIEYEWGRDIKRI
jgi:hypothetical protein